MPVNLSRNEPKLNSMYRITIESSEATINCRINFKIIDFIYWSLVRKHNVNKTAYYKKLYEFLDIGEKYYETLRNGKKIGQIVNDKAFRYVKINRLISGEDRLEITGVSIKEWKWYFWICQKYTDLKKDKADKRFINEAKRRKEQFQNRVLRKIDNMEMNEGACDIYRKLSKYLFENELSKYYRSKGESWTIFLENINKSDLEGLWRADKDKYSNIYRILYTLLKQMKNIKDWK